MSQQLKLTAFLVQGSAALIIGSLTSLTGFVFAWPSYTIEFYQSNNTVLQSPITSTQVSILGSITNLGGLIATPFCGYAVDKIGRKYSAIIFGLPFIISWTLIVATTSFYVVVFAMGIAGIGAAGQAISSVYISEVCQDSIRGALTSSTVYGYYIGLLSSYSFGGYMAYYNVLYMHLAFSTLYVFMLMFLKESPCYLIKCGKTKEAAKSIAFYKQIDISSNEIEIEIEKIKLQLDTCTGTNLYNRDTKAIIEDSQSSEKFLKAILPVPFKKNETAWHFFKKSESSQRAMTTVLIVLSVTILMGSIVLQVYAEPLFKEAVPTMHPNTCSILLAADFLIASLISASMLDKFGRKTLLTVTSIFSGIFAILIGTQLHLHWAPFWFTAFTIYGYSFVYNLGGAIVPYVLIAEVFLPEVRGLGNSIAMTIMWFMTWFMLVIFKPLVEVFGLGLIFFIFAISCFSGAAYSHFCLPETKGLSVDAIQLLFMKRTRNCVVNA